MNKNVLHDCLYSAMEGKMSFPETVKRMIETGVERYRADLVLLEKCHYMPQGETHIEKIPLRQAPAIASKFSIDQVRSALKQVQQEQIDYPEFLRRIMAAGTTDYTVHITGRKAVYTGRAGDFYVENFPSGS
jgi:uncharacterized protein YbcV (DUF1398 family)